MSRKSNHACRADADRNDCLPQPFRARFSRHLPAGLLALFLTTLLSSGTVAQTNSALSVTGPLPSNRWLFVIETSSAMKDRQDAIQNLAGAVLVSGANGQMQPGDTVGLWTFNENLYAGQFPIQDWNPNSCKTIAWRFLEFLQDQQFEKKPSFEKVFPGLQQVIKGSDFLTVILISSGEFEIKGTPFDDKINAGYRNWRKQARKSLTPILTVLRASHGKITDYAVTAPPWPLEMPPLPLELQMAAARRAAPAPAPVPTPPPTLPPLIVSGRKPAATPEPAPAETTAVVVTSPEIIATTNRPDAPAATVPNTASTASATPANPPARSAGPKAETPEARPQALAVLARETPADSRPAAAGESKPAADPEAPGALAVTTPARSFFSGKIIWIAGAGLIVVAFAFILLAKRRSRPAGRISLITRSFDRENE